MEAGKAKKESGWLNMFAVAAEGASSWPVEDRLILHVCGGGEVLFHLCVKLLFSL